MQFIVNSDWSFAVFCALALVMMLLATYFIFTTRFRWDERNPKGGAMTRWKILPDRSLPTLIAFGMMLVGMALVGSWYYIQRPIVDDYTFNILAVTLVAGFVAAIASYGIALIGLYAKSVKGRDM